MKDVIALSELVEKIDFQQKLALEARHMLERDYTDRELYERFEAAAKELVSSQGWLSEEEAAERTRDYSITRCITKKSLQPILSRGTWKAVFGVI